jgi:hypothetical protein
VREAVNAGLRMKNIRWYWTGAKPRLPDGECDCRHPWERGYAGPVIETFVEGRADSRSGFAFRVIAHPHITPKGRRKIVDDIIIRERSKVMMVTSRDGGMRK